LGGGNTAISIMPLVTRQANQGVFFKTATEPPDWQNSDIWIDTDNSNLAINRDGTAVQQLLGTYVQGDILHASATDTITALNIGNATQILTVNAGGDDAEWAAAPAGVTTNRLTDDIASDFTTTSTSFVDTGVVVTLSNQTGGNARVSANFSHRNTGSNLNRFNLSDDDVDQSTVIITSFMEKYN